MYKFLEQTETIDYTGEQLCSQFNYKLTKHAGDSITAFYGKMNVNTDYMVDTEDVINNDFIYSPYAVNFIIELFNISMGETALYQIAFMRIIYDCLKNYMEIKEKSDNKKLKYNLIRLDGDDIYLYRDDAPAAYKLSVSIATKSILSGLIHVGLNINLDNNVPVLAAGLGEMFEKSEIDFLVQKIQTDFCLFVEDIKNRMVKVKGV